MIDCCRIYAATTDFCNAAFCVELILSPKLNAMPCKDINSELISSTHIVFLD